MLPALNRQRVLELGQGLVGVETRAVSGVSSSEEAAEAFELVPPAVVYGSDQWTPFLGVFTAALAFSCEAGALREWLGPGSCRWEGVAWGALAPFAPLGFLCPRSRACSTSVWSFPFPSASELVRVCPSPGSVSCPFGSVGSVIPVDAFHRFRNFFLLDI